MKIIKRYIIDEWFSLFLLGLLFISFILVVGNIIRLVEMVIAKGVPLQEVGRLFCYLIPSLLIFSLPIAVLTATLLTFGRMAYDNEITALRASGVSFYRLLGSMTLIGLFFSAISFYSNNTLIPAAHFEMRKIIKNIALKNPAAYLEEKTFIKAFRDHIIFVYKIHDQYLEDVHIYQPHTDRPTRSIVAQKGEFISLPENNTIKFVLRNGMADEPSFNPNDNTYYQLKFKTYYLTLQLENPQERVILDKKIKDMSITELLEEIQTMRNMNVDPLPLQIGLHRKLSLSFSSLLFIWIGLPLGVSVKRRERSLAFGVSLIICLGYYLLMALGETLAMRQLIDPITGGWFPAIVLLCASLWLIPRMLEG